VTSLTEALPASVRGVTFVAYSFRSGRFGNLAKFIANRRASYGEKRKCATALQTTLMTHPGRRVWTRRSIINVGDGRKVLGSGHRTSYVSLGGTMRRRDLVTFVAAAVWPGIAPA
jgi:hypothetical protein